MKSKQVSSLAVAFAIIGVASVAAQSRPEADRTKEIKLTGCLQRNTSSSPAGTTDAAQLRRVDNHLVEVKGTLDTAGSVEGTSASVTEGPSGTIHATEVMTVSGRCGE